MGAKAAKSEPKTFELKQAEFQLSRICKIFERAEASKENSWLIFFSERCILKQNGLIGNLYYRRF